MTKELAAKKFAELSAQIEERDAQLRKIMVRAEEVSAELRATDNTDHNAAFLGKILYDQDETYGAGTVLCLEWALDYFMAHAFEKAYPLLLKIHKLLVENGRNQRNKYEYFKDSEAFFIYEDRPICVFGPRWRDAPRYLWIDDRENFLDTVRHRSYVRQVWQRTRLDCIGGVDHPVLRHYRERDFDMKFYDTRFRVYGDARDRGHVLTYENLYGRAKCDKVIWDVGAPLGFLFEVNTLHTQLLEE